MRRLISIVSSFKVAAAFALLIAAGHVSAMVQNPTPTRAALAHTWVGSDDHLAYFRLLLDASGQGLLAIESSAADRSISLYRVEDITVSGYRISFALAPIKVPDEQTLNSVRLSGEYQYGAMRLTWSGTDNGHVFWSSNVILEPEERVLSRSELLRRAATSYLRRGGR